MELLRRLVLALVCVGLAHSAKDAQVTTTAGTLRFTAGDSGDIVFQPGTGRALYLSGVKIESVADLKGQKGDGGVKGDQGVAGLKGDAGVAGVDGVQGPAGKDGTQGSKGDQGIKGDQGVAGIQGIKGDIGPTGADGTAGIKGATGPQGLQGTKGDSGGKGEKGGRGAIGDRGPAGAGACGSDFLPTGPLWLNVDKKILQANTAGQILRVVTLGLTPYYHPDSEPSYWCKFYSPTTNRTTISPKTVLTVEYNNMTKTAHYSVDCLVPVWNLIQKKGSPPVFEEIVNVTLLFQDSKEVLFAGQALSNQVQFSVGWFNATTLTDGSVSVFGAGFNTSATFLCQFSNISGLGVALHINATGQLARGSTYIRCIPPHWNFSKDSRTEVVTQITIYEEDPATNTVRHILPFRGMLRRDDIYEYFRCRDGVPNGAEADVDCGGLCPNLCPAGAKCNRNSDCQGGHCETKTKKCLLRGQIRSYPADNCRVLTYNQSGIAWIKWPGTVGGVVQTYCEMNKSIDGGGWTMVWKHAYFQAPKATRLNDLRTYSTYYEPCLGINPTNSGTWCNMPKKQQSGYSEMMIAAYHNDFLVYAYKSTRNTALGSNHDGARFTGTVTTLYDRCTSYRRSYPPYPARGYSSYYSSGITFMKYYSSYYGRNCDTDWSRYGSDCRWEECYLPTSISATRRYTQMTMAIYIR